MRLITGQIDFSRWKDGDEIFFEVGDQEASIKNSFLQLNISVSIDENLNDKFFYDQKEQILVLYRGKLILDKISNNSSTDNTIHKLSSLYRKQGAEFLKNIYGSFNLVLIDFFEKKIILCNDSVGILRIYYRYKNGILFFSTQLSKLLQAGISLNNEGILQYLMFNYYYDDNTLYSDIYWVLPGSVNEFSTSSVKKIKYFDLFDHVYSYRLANNENGIQQVAETLNIVVKDYLKNEDALLTLTSGFDSRLLLASVTSLKSNIFAFTFGQKDNIEFEISQEIVSKINNLKYLQILLDDEFKNFSKSYSEYLIESKNVELNFNRFHYVYVWKKLLAQDFKLNILTGLCGDSFLRDGMEVGTKTNELLFNLVNTTNKEKTIRDYIFKKLDLLHELGFNEGEIIERLVEIFLPIKNNDKYFNHFFIKIKFGIQKYFATELNTENIFLDTYSPFLDLRYINSLISSGFSNLDYDFLDKKVRYQNISHKFYASLIKSLDDKLLNITTNRGYPLSLALKNKHIPLKLFQYYQFKRKSKIHDLNYSELRVKDQYLDNPSISFDDAYKIKFIRTMKGDV